MKKVLANKGLQTVLFILTIVGLCSAVLFACGLFLFNRAPLEYYAELPPPTGEDAAIVWFYGERRGFVAYLLISAVVAIASLVLLLIGVGRDREGNPKKPGRFVLPFDLTLFAAGWIVAGSCVFLYDAIYFSYFVQRYSTIVDDMAIILSSIAVVGTEVLLVLLLFAAQLRMKTLWKSLLVYRVARWCIRLVRRFARMIVRAIPLLWKAILIFIAFLLADFILILVFMESGSFFAFLFLMMFNLAALSLIIMFMLQLEELLKAGEILAGGDLSYHVDTAKLMLDAKRHGEHLNSIRDGMGKAVEARMKNERFKTELITNVSHDLKTPLTSIVSYVDLLDREKLENPKAREYVEILKRQSGKLKKLTEDLIEASKASSGVISVNREMIRVEELLQQSIAEYEMRFAQAGIKPVLRVQDENTVVCADGRLLWRVLDNLLSNICKYAHPDTRAYFDVSHLLNVTLISFKNMSAQELNIDPSELTERFIRGDASRHTEGSGLGLSIAQSLTELQGGRFSIAIDGDLFKVNIEFDDEPQMRTPMEVPAEIFEADAE